MMKFFFLLHTKGRGDNTTTMTMMFINFANKKIILKYCGNKYAIYSLLSKRSPLIGRTISGTGRVGVHTITRLPASLRAEL